MTDEQQSIHMDFPAGEIKGPDPGVWGKEARIERGAWTQHPDELLVLPKIPWKARILAWLGRGTASRGPS